MTDRPVLRLKKRPVELVIEAIAILGLVVTMAMVAISWPAVPESIPHHFDFAGKPDAWGGKWVLILLPAISVAMHALLTGISRIPHRFNYVWEITEQNAERQYRIALSLLLILKTEVVMMFGYLTWATIRSTQDGSAGLGRAFLPVLIGIVLATILIHLIAACRDR